MTTHRRFHPGEMLLSLVFIAIGSFVVFQTQSIAETQGFSQVGPRLFPNIIGSGLSLCGAWLGWQALTGGWRNVPDDEGEHEAPEWMAFAIVSAGVILHMVLIGWAGFIIASTLLFVLVARGFGSKRPVRDVIVAAIVAILVYFLFTAGLGLNLPAGPFKVA